MVFFLLIVTALTLVAMGMTWKLTGFITEDVRRKVLRGFLLLLDAVMLAVIPIGPFFFREVSWAAEALTFFSVCLTAQCLFCVFVSAALLIRRILRIIRQPAGFQASRRRLLKNGLLYPVAALGLSLYGNQWERQRTVVNRHVIPVSGLPAEFDGLQVAQISDVHIGMFYSIEMLQELLQQAADLKPDLLVITGDIFDDVRLNPEAIRLTDSFTERFPKGIWYCHGNHEHHRGIGAIEKQLQQTRLHVLVNAAEPVVTGKKFYIAGVDYPMRRQEEVFQQDKAEYIAEAMKSVPEDAACLLLAHHPEFIDDARNYGIPLTLTGHTHGSQFGIFGIPVFPVFKYTRGLFREGDCYGYVHVGNGSWFPCRIGCPPEIAVFTLTGKES